MSPPLPVAHTDDEDVHSQFNDAVVFLFAVACNNDAVRRSHQSSSFAQLSTHVRIEEHRLKSTLHRARQFKLLLEEFSVHDCDASASATMLAESATTALVPDSPQQSPKTFLVPVARDSFKAALARLSWYNQTVPLIIERQRSSTNSGSGNYTWYSPSLSRKVEPTVEDTAAFAAVRRISRASEPICGVRCCAAGAIESLPVVSNSMMRAAPLAQPASRVSQTSSSARLPAVHDEGDDTPRTNNSCASKAGISASAHTTAQSPA